MNNTASTSAWSILKMSSASVVIVQLLLVVFLYIDSLLIFTFFQKEHFRTEMRYIFFIHTLLCDWLYLCLSNTLLILSFFSIPMVVGLCVTVVFVVSMLNFTTPLTLVAMSIERFVAICLPLRHAEISTVRRAIYCIFIIHGLSSIQIFAISSAFIASIPSSFYASYKTCQVEIMLIYKWQSYLRAGICQFYFLSMSCVIMFTYVKIVAAAKVAASDKKKSASKAHHTVILHGIQLLLCMLQFWTPFVEVAVLDINIYLYIFVRYFDYITFVLAPRCLCPLVYGLRDEKFFTALRYYALYGLKKKITSQF